MISARKLSNILKNNLRCILIVITLLHSQFLAYSQHSLEKTIRKATKNTYTAGTYTYSMEYKTVTPNLDTLKDTYSVFFENGKNYFSYCSIHQDSLTEIYYDNLALRCNTNSKSYWMRNFEYDDALYEFDEVFKPFVDKTFKDYYFGDSVTYTKVFEDKDKLVLKFSIFDPGDVDNLFILTTILKDSHTISEYSFNSSVGGIPLYENWKLLSKPKMVKGSDSSDAIKNLFYKTIRTFKPYCSNESYRVAESGSTNQLTLTELQGIIPTLHLVSTANDTLVLSNLESKYYLVEFWFRSCFPCIKSLPTLKELHSKYNETYLKLISINNVDKSIELIEKFKLDNNIPYDVFMESVEYGKKFESINSYPTFILYDSQFNVLKTFKGYTDNLMIQIEEIIKTEK